MSTEICKYRCVVFFTQCLDEGIHQCFGVECRECLRRYRAGDALLELLLDVLLDFLAKFDLA